jgi:hypothetical protein
MGAANPPYDEGTFAPLERAVSEPADAPTRPLIMPTGGEGCMSCGVSLASDQRYCVNCGERRGQARFSVATMAVQPAAAPVAQARPRRMGSGTTLIAGVATLLLAMGVGVLIGQSGNNGSTRAAATTPPVINVNAGGGGSSATASKPAASTASTGSLKSPTVHITKKVAAAAAAAAANVTGGSAPVNPTVTVGQGCSANTAGCQGGKFTGNFFGP